MAKAVQLYKGGTPYATFPACSGQKVFGPPFPETVAGEYARGDFTLGNSLSPKFRPYQAEALTGFAAGDVVELVVVPQKTAVTSLFVETDPVPQRTVHNSALGCVSDSMAGVTFDVVGTFYDNTTFESVGTVTIPAALLGLDASVAAAAHAFKQIYVPAGQSLVLGVKLKTVPTNVTFAEMAGTIALVAKVHDFQHPYIA